MENLYLIIHNGLRWLLLIFLILTIILSLKGIQKGEKYSSISLKINNWTSHIAHLQVVFGFLIYINNFWYKLPIAIISISSYSYPGLFFSIMHPTLMIISVIIITIGNIRSKQQANDPKRFISTLKWSAISLILILIAIPWPFYSSVSRPILRFF